MAAIIRSRRLVLRPFEIADATDVFACITPEVTCYMRWDPPVSMTEFRTQREVRMRNEEHSTVSLVIRRTDTEKCLGMAAVEGLQSVAPEIGLWLKASAHGVGYGREIVDGLVAWVSKNLQVTDLVYPVAVENIASRRIAEALGGRVMGSRSGVKYDSVVYVIPLQGDQGG